MLPKHRAPSPLRELMVVKDAAAAEARFVLRDLRVLVQV